MQEGGTKKRVELTRDLTKYNSNCVIGAKGYTIPDVKLSNFGNFDDFVAVKFDNGAKMDVAVSSLKFD